MRAAKLFSVLALFENVVFIRSEQCYGLEKLLWGVRHPVTVAHLPNSDQDVLVGEHRGTVVQMSLRGFSNDKVNVFLNITDKIITSNEPADERGLLSFVLDPEFPKEKSVYVCYSAPTLLPGMDHETKVSKFTVSRNQREKWEALSESEVVLLVVEQRDRRYNGGQLLFGPDRFLYVTTGDDGSDTSHRFDLSSLLGKVLRLDVRGRQRYAVPDDNPFVGVGPPVRPEVFAYGFRNPWRCTVFSFDQTTGNVSLLCGDTGVSPHGPEEEVYLVEAGKRYGWSDTNRAPCVGACKAFRKDGGGAGLVAAAADGALPVFRYTKSGGQAIVGGIVYGGKAIAPLRGKFLYADFVHGSLHSLDAAVDNQGTWTSEDLCLKPCGRQLSRLEPFYVLSIGTDSNDEPLILTTTELRNDAPAGVIYRLTGGDCKAGLEFPQGTSGAAGDGVPGPVAAFTLGALLAYALAPPASR
ncbi:HHIP-like protein 1 [Haemaphysalis longicornis]